MYGGRMYISSLRKINASPLLNLQNKPQNSPHKGQARPPFLILPLHLPPSINPLPTIRLPLHIPLSHTTSICIILLILIGKGAQRNRIWERVICNRQPTSVVHGRGGRFSFDPYIAGVVKWGCWLWLVHRGWVLVGWFWCFVDFGNVWWVHGDRGGRYKEETLWKGREGGGFVCGLCNREKFGHAVTI